MNVSLVVPYVWTRVSCGSDLCEASTLQSDGCIPSESRSCTLRKFCSCLVSVVTTWNSSASHVRYLKPLGLEDEPLKA